MRKCRRMISMILFMVMLVTMIPSGALAAEAPTGETSEFAAVEELQSETEETADAVEPGEIADTGDEKAAAVEETTDKSSDSVTVETAEEGSSEAATKETAQTGEPSEGQENSSEAATEDAGLGDTSMEVAPVVEPVEKDKKGAGEPIDLDEYFKTHSGSVTKSLEDDQRKEITPTEDGGYILEWDKEYIATVTVTTKAIEPNTYTTKLPDGFTYRIYQPDEQEKKWDKIIRIDGVDYGTVSVTEDGLVTIVFNDDINFSQDTKLDFDFTFSINEKEVHTIYWNDMPIDIVKPAGNVLLEKAEHGRTLWSDIDEKYHIHWTTDVVHDDQATPEGAKLVDTIYSTKVHQFTQADIDKGIIVTATKGDQKVTWNIITDDPGNFTWSSKQWTYQMPVSMKGTTFDEGWIFVFDYYTTIVSVPNGTAISYLNYANYYRYVGSTSHGEDTHHWDDTGDQNIKKYGDYVLDEHNRMKGMKYRIVETLGKPDPDSNYGITDLLFYYYWTSQADPASDTGNIGKSKQTSVPLELVPAWDDMKVTLEITDDNNEVKTLDLPIYGWNEEVGETAEGGFYAVYATLDDHQFGEQWGHRRQGILVLNKNSDGETNKTKKSMIEGKRAVITLEYYQEHNDTLQTYLTNQNITTLRNTACVWRNKHTGEYSDDYVAYIGRKKMLVGNPTPENDYTAEFKITFPISKRAKDVYVVDEMSDTMAFDVDSVTIQKYQNETIDGKIGTALKPIGEAYTVDASAITTEKIEGGKRIKIKLEEYPDTVNYELTYKVRVSNAMTDAVTYNGKAAIPMSNDFYLLYDGERTSITRTEKFNSNFNSVTKRYGVIINKTDENGEPLEGAVFDLFNGSGAKVTLEGEVLKTSEDGTVDFTTNVKKNIVYDQNEPYYIMETAAPAGYGIVDTKFWFVVSDEKFAGYHDDDYWKDYFEGKGIEEYTIVHAEGNTGIGEITVSNKPVVNVKVDKVWDDNDNAGNIRPESITVQLKADGKNKGDAVSIKADDEGSYSYVWKNLDKFDADGKEITYSVEETKVNGYEDPEYGKVVKSKDAEGNTVYSISITNKLPSKLSITVTKKWDDADNQDGVRQPDVKVVLFGDDAFTGDTGWLREDNKWTLTWTNLPRYNEDGKEVKYEVKEAAVSGGYTPTYGKLDPVKDKAGNIVGYKIEITNTHVPATTSVSVRKVWNDGNDQDRKRPAEIKVQLKADGAASGTAVTLNAANGWKYTWTGLAKFKAGTAIKYTVEEDESSLPEGYKLVSVAEDTDKPDDVAIGYVITNEYTPDVTSIHVKKEWVDNDDADGMRPAQVEVELHANGVPRFPDGTGIPPVILSESNKWEYEWKNLPVNYEGKEITYTVKEINVPLTYPDQTVSGDAEKGFVLTNTRNTNTTDIEVHKEWDDADNQDGKRPESIKVQLLANGVQKEEVELSESNSWSYKWEDLPTNEKGKKINYRVTETTPDGYKLSQEMGAAKEERTIPDLHVHTEIVITFVNSYTPEKVSILANKEWDDAGDQDGKRPESITVKLTADAGPVKDNPKTETLSEENGWACEWKELDKMAGGKKINYQVEEEGVSEEYEKTVKMTESGNTYTFSLTNKHTPEKIDIDVEKVWDDADDMDQARPENVTVTLMADGAAAAEAVVLSEENDWAAEWKELDRYKDGKEIKYTVEEAAVEGYTTEYDFVENKSEDGKLTGYSFTVTNAHKERPVNISKVDVTSQAEVAGAKLQVLDSDGNIVDEWVSAEDGVPHIVHGLTPDQEYTMRETVAPLGYTIAADTTFKVDAEGKVTSEATVTEGNVLLVEDTKTKVHVRKVDIANGKELPGATLQILDQEGNIVEEWESTEEDRVIEGLLTNTEYTLREIVAPESYFLTSDTTFTIDENNKVTSTGTTTTTEDGTPVLVVEDERVHAWISKKAIGGEEELPGATLQILDSDGNVVVVKDSNGNDVKLEWISGKEPHLVEGLLADVTYTLREIIAPNGYLIASDIRFFVDAYGNVTSSGKVTEDGVILIEDAITVVEILKVDSKTGKGLDGAKLQVLDDNGTVCEEWESTTEAHTITGLYTGVEYTLHEVSAPKGYDRAKDITFTIDQNGKVNCDSMKDGRIIMKDTPTPPGNKTGDEANGALWALLLALAGGALGGIVWFRRKKMI